MKINSNMFYVACEKQVYICIEKIPGLTKYTVYKNGEELANSDDTDFTRPYEFDNDHHTELFKPETRNWIYIKDSNVQDFQRYYYQIKGEGGHTSESYVSDLIGVYTE